MNLKERLARLDGTKKTSLCGQDKPSPHDFSKLLPGTVCQNSLGCFWRHRIEFDSNYRHGRFVLKDFLNREPEFLRFAAKDPSLNQLALDRLLFIDAETTGLSGGVGTLAFIVGVGYFEGDRFIIEQFFLRRFEEEGALLKEFMELLQRKMSLHGALVSFNGKSYDVPLLSNRSVLHRLDNLPDDCHHIDMLHAARRLWKNILPDCALGTLESELLQINRKGDVPAHLIPGIFFRYIRTADPRPLLPVLYHNQMDILSMVSLLNLILKLFSQKKPVNTVPVDLVAMGRIFERLHEYDKGMSFYSNLLRSPITEKRKKEILLRQAKIHKKNRNFRKAIPLWQQAISCQGFCIEPYEELAKVFEHHVADLPRAKEYTQRALENVRLIEQLYPDQASTVEKAGLAWRLKRLERKLNR